MSEFVKRDALLWLALAWEKECSIQSAIYYSLFFECQRDDKKYTRALEFFERELGFKKENEEANS